jgi:hypothetical protein
VFVVIAAMLDPKHAPHILGGGLLAMGLMYGQYVHARRCGLRSTLPGTEDYGQQQPGFSGEQNVMASYKPGA